MHHGKTLPDVLADLGRIVMECAGSDGCFMSIDGNVYTNAEYFTNSSGLQYVIDNALMWCFSIFGYIMNSAGYIKGFWVLWAVLRVFTFI